MRNRTILLTLFTGLLACPLASQKACDTANETANPTFLLTATSWFLFKLQAQQPMVVTGLEFYLWAFAATTTTTIGVYDEDTATGRPNQLLASSPVNLLPDVQGWYGASFAQPVIILPNDNYFVGVMLGNGIWSGADPAGQTVTHYWNPPTWSGPFNTQRWMYRVHCGAHQGSFTEYGTGKAGTGALVPALSGWTFPNTGNNVSVRLSNAIASSPAILLWGFRNDLPLPVGTVYVFPILATTAATTSASGWHNTDIPIPNDPTLAGGRIAFQAWIADPGAAGGFSHTNGLELLVGH